MKHIIMPIIAVACIALWLSGCTNGATRHCDPSAPWDQCHESQDADREVPRSDVSRPTPPDKEPPEEPECPEKE